MICVYVSYGGISRFGIFFGQALSIAVWCRSGGRGCGAGGGGGVWVTTVLATLGQFIRFSVTRKLPTLMHSQPTRVMLYPSFDQLIVLGMWLIVFMICSVFGLNAILQLLMMAWPVHVRTQNKVSWQLIRRLL